MSTTSQIRFAIQRVQLAEDIKAFLQTNETLFLIPKMAELHAAPWAQTYADVAALPVHNVEGPGHDQEQ